MTSGTVIDVALARDLERLWRERIPITAAMDVRIARLDAHACIVTAPLSPNRNQHGTVFGGSIQALATLAGWGAAVTMLDRDTRAETVIQAAEIRFMRPGTGDLAAHCRTPAGPARERFLATLQSRGRARIVLPVTVMQGDREIATFAGTYVTLGAKPG